LLFCKLVNDIELSSGVKYILRELCSSSEERASEVLSCEVSVAFSRNLVYTCRRKAEISLINCYKFCSQRGKSVFFHSRKQWLVIVLEIVSVVFFHVYIIQNVGKVHGYNIEPGRIRRL